MTDEIDAYRVNKLLYRIGIDRGLLDRVNADFHAVAAEAGLTDREREALRGADLRALYAAGVHPFLLSAYSRHGLFGMDRETFQSRIQKVPRGPRPWSRR